MDELKPCLVCGGIIYHAQDCYEEEEQGLSVGERHHLAAVRSIQPGTVWRHYKGEIYLVTDLLRHTEDQEDLVCYHRLGGDDEGGPSGWARPVTVWLEEVDVVLPDGEPYIGPKFRKISPATIKSALGFWGD